MTRYNVHLFREMRLFFPGIEAESQAEAAGLAAGLDTCAAGEVDDCNGEDLGALVDVVGDEEYEHSVTIDFEGERQRKAAQVMLAALQAFIDADVLAEECGEWKWENLEHAFALARSAIADATEGTSLQPTKPIVIEVRGGVVQDVLNVPPGCQYEIRDYDNIEADEEAAGSAA